MSTAKKSKKGVTIYTPGKACEGYTLIAPQGGYNVWLIDMEGNIVHHWPLQYQPCFFARLLPNGNLLYQGREEENIEGPVLKVLDANHNPIGTLVLGGGQYMIEIDRNNKEVWRYENPFLSHDFFRMDNGNTMAVTYVQLPDNLKEKVVGGIPVDPTTPFWCDGLIEVNPKGEVVWEWKSYEHLAFEKAPLCPLMHRCEWTHMNTCTVLDTGDVLGSFRHLNIICIIDKKTGKIKWQWGQREVAHQHEPIMLDNGNILVLDNGEHREGSNYSYSRVVEVNPKTNKIEWEYTADPPYSWFTGNQAGCQRMPNGNTVITDAIPGRVFEVTKDKEIVWEYMSPFYGPHANQKPNPLLYRAYRYERSFPGLKGLELKADNYKMFNAVYGNKGLK